MSRFIKSLVLGGVMAALLPSVMPATASAAAVSTTTTVSFEPAQDRYPRGQWITLKAVARDQYGQRVAPPGRVTFEKRSTLGTVTLFTVQTDANGVARKSFQVPTNVNDDYVYIVARYSDPLGFYGKSSGEKRIPIGR